MFFISTAASCTPEQGSCLTSKKRRKNPPAVLKDITKISQIFVGDKGNMQSNTVDGTCEDHDSDDDDADIDNDIDFRGLLIYYLASLLIVVLHICF